MHVYMRITVDSISCDISTKRKCSPEKWSAIANRMTGKNEEGKVFNSYLDTLQQKVFEAKRKLIELDNELSSENIKILLCGKQLNQQKYLLMEIFKKHNEQMAALVGSEYATGTIERYNTACKHTLSFL
jgi:bifunctional ADP-heptose synthase (sugar kinase/adenylyltransferase)